MTYFSNIVPALDGSAPYVCGPRPHLHGRRVDWHSDDDAARREGFAVLRRASETASRGYGLTIETKRLDGEIVPEIVVHAAAAAHGAGIEREAPTVTARADASRHD